MKLRLAPVIFLTCFLSCLSTVYSAPLCSSFLTTAPRQYYISTHEVLESTYEVFMEDPTREHLTDHLEAAHDHLSAEGISNTIFEDNIVILPDGPLELNRFSKDVIAEHQAMVIYSPQSFIEQNSLASFHFHRNENGSITPLSIRISYESVLTTSFGPSEAHEMSHLNQSRFSSKRIPKGNVFNAEFSDKTTTHSFDEITAYFADLNKTLEDFSERLISFNNLRRSFYTQVTNLNHYLLGYKLRLVELKNMVMLPFSHPWVRLNKTSYKTVNGEFEILFAEHSSNKHMVTFIIKTKSGITTIHLKDLVEIDLKNMNLIFVEGSPLLQILFSKLKLQISEMDAVNQKAQRVVDDFLIDDAIFTEPHSSFIENYRAAVLPHL